MPYSSKKKKVYSLCPKMRPSYSIVGLGFGTVGVHDHVIRQMPRQLVIGLHM